MSQKERLVELFKRYGGKMTLGQLLQYPEGYKCTSRFSDLRELGFKIDCSKGERPSDNLYTMTEPEPSGQMRLA